MGRLLGLLVLAPILFLIAVAGASELGGEVVSLETMDADDTRFVTSVWIVDLDGQLWLRGGDPEAAWVQRLRERPVAKLTRDGQVREVEVAFVEHYSAEINRAMREKYGWADRIVTLIHDSDEVVAFRLRALDF